MIEAGILGDDERVELLVGEIVQMSPQEKPHARAIAKLNRWFAQALGDEFVVRPQLPLTLADSEPEPDLAIVRADDEAAAERHPRTALLVIEVADSKLVIDHGTRGPFEPLAERLSLVRRRRFTVAEYRQDDRGRHSRRPTSASSCWRERSSR